MFSIYKKIDSSLLSKLNNDEKRKITNICLEYIISEEQISTEYEKRIRHLTVENIIDNNLINPWIFHCPYCNLSSTIFFPPLIKMRLQPIFCVHCGDASPNYKIQKSLYKTDIIVDLLKYKILKKAKRTLLEQSIVMIATGLEVYLRDTYSILLNLRYVKNENSLFERFYQECRNEFINMGKAKKKYQDDIGIDLSSIFGNDNFKKINLLMLKRNVIVHNIGIVDRTFQSQSGIACHLKSPVPIRLGEIKEDIRIIQKFITDISLLFKEEFDNEMIKRVH